MMSQDRHLIRKLAGAVQKLAYGDGGAIKLASEVLAELDRQEAARGHAPRCLTMATYSSTCTCGFAAKQESQIGKADHTAECAARYGGEDCTGCVKSQIGEAGSVTAAEAGQSTAQELPVQTSNALPASPLPSSGSSPETCQIAGCTNPVTCFGAYESDANRGYGCDKHCGHGNEDGWCMPVDEWRHSPDCAKANDVTHIKGVCPDCAKPKESEPPVNTAWCVCGELAIAKTLTFVDYEGTRHRTGLPCYVMTVDKPEPERCTCGSGAHPRHCKLHPENFDKHVAELNEPERGEVLSKEHILHRRAVHLGPRDTLTLCDSHEELRRQRDEAYWKRGEAILARLDMEHQRDEAEAKLAARARRVELLEAVAQEARNYIASFSANGEASLGWMMDVLATLDAQEPKDG